MDALQSDVQKLMEKKLIQKNKTEIAYWCGFSVVLFFGYKFFSDGGFSAILTLASAFQTFAFFLLAVKIYVNGTCAGVSSRSLQLYVPVFMFRLSSTVFFNGYLPVDRSGDWVYQLADFLALLSVLFVLMSMHSSFQMSYQKSDDAFPILFILMGAAVLAVLVHPSLNNWLPADIAWTYALYVETMAMVPQLFMMTKIGGEVEALTSHYIASVAASRFLSFLFWMFSYSELAPKKGLNVAGYGIMVAYILQLLVFADFVYHYIQSMRSGKALIIPQVHV